MLVVAERADLSFNAQWLREMRQSLGWSTTETAEHAREAAAELDDDIRISQQLVSAFENGKHKATPRWLGYVQIAMSHYIARRNLDVPRLWELRLPTTMTNFFAIRRADANEKVEWEELGGAEPLAVQLTANDDEVEIDSIDLAYGMGGTFVDDDSGVEVEKARFSRNWLRKFTNSPPQMLFSSQGAGDSMMPTIHDRDVVIIDRSQRSLVDQMGDKIWAIVFGELGMIKRIRQLPNGDLVISSDNQVIRDQVASRDEVHIVGRVIAKVSRL